MPETEQEVVSRIACRVLGGLEWQETAEAANFLEKIPRTHYYHSKGMPYCRKCGTPNVLRLD